MKTPLIIALIAACWLASACTFTPYRPIPEWQGTTVPGGNYPASNLSEGGNPDKGQDSQ